MGRGRYIAYSQRGRGVGNTIRQGAKNVIYPTLKQEGMRILKNVALPILKEEGVKAFSFDYYPIT